MDPMKDERVLSLNARIQQEQDPQKLIELVNELMRLLDVLCSTKNKEERAG